MRTALLFVLLSTLLVGYSQDEQKISTIDFVQIVNDNSNEAVYYFRHNWKLLREMALEKKYIHSYQLLETPSSPNGPFQMMLITTYSSQKAYIQSEARFDELIAEREDLNLMNHKKPSEFRKVLFNKLATHMN